MSHASSRSSRPSAIAASAARKKAQRTSWFECPSPSRGISTFSKCWWRLRNWLLDTATSWRWFMNGNNREGTRTGQRSPSPGRWLPTCSPSSAENRTSCLRENSAALPLRETFPGMKRHQDHSVRRLPGPADDGLSDGGNSRGSHRFVSGLAENTNSIFCADSSESQTANGCPVLRRAGTTSREAQLRNGGYLIRPIARSPERAQKSCAFRLTMTYMDVRHPPKTPKPWKLLCPQCS